MPRKIFDLAKELDMKPLDLVEDLKAKGYAVRNHMTSLEDADVEKILADFSAKAEEEAAAKKTTKKKTKKKVTKKKVTKASGEGTSKKKVAKKKKATVIRRKSGDEDALEASEQEALAAESTDTDVAETTTKVIKKTKKKVVKKTAESSSESLGDLLGTNDDKEDTSGGLRVVSKPEKKVASETTGSDEAQTAEEKELYKEKVHKFTPVFIPEKVEASEDGSDQDDSSEDSSDKKKDDGKKRLGGLASMMSGKKTAVSKSQTLQQQRADSELKSYAALSGSGRPIYTQVKKKRAYSGPSKSTEITEVKDSKRVVKIHDVVTGQDLARKLKVKLKELVDQCLDLNLLVKGEDYIGIQLASEIAALYGYRVENVAFDEEKVIGNEELSEEEKEKLPLRTPIVTIMGHVDHGKTTLLDYIRNAKVADGEAGGITQHIGAYSVKTNNGRQLTFLDTPGHAAFGAMRQRGADVTDIVILVVAADDGVMPQTKESVRFIKNADVPMIVAINKMDKDDANPDRVKQELTEFHITPEEWGGDTLMVPISALKGDGVDDLLDNVALQAEMLELRASDKGAAEGVVIESKIEGGRGPVATILVQKGTLKKGDSIVVGETYGRARSLTDHTGKILKNAGPSTPVQILGLDQAPSPGDTMNVVKNEREAKKIAENRVDDRKKVENSVAPKTVSLEDFFATAADEVTGKKTLNLIVRSDVQGSYEAIKTSLESLSNQEVEVKMIGGGVGPVSDSDVTLAETSEAIICGFNMRPSTSARRLAETKGIEVRTYSIIYELINDVTDAIEGMLDPERVEKYIGRAEVKDTFVVPKVGTIAGSVVVDGAIKVGCQVRLLRNGRIVFDGTMSSLKRFKDDVKEVKSGYECGVGLEGYNDVKVGDLFEAYIMEEKKRSLEDIAKEEAQKAKEAEKAAELAAQESLEDSTM
ncbi:MAG: translation initiation factor IF-2 [Oligoflexia bacterium]|nr:translation initiation factor IF-2 [Oligoflexia bacterium]